MDSSSDQVIASCWIQPIDIVSGLQPVHVCIMLPVLRRAGVEGDWKCEFAIHGISPDRNLVAIGADSVQALHLALALAGQELANCKEAPLCAHAGLVGKWFPPLPPLE